jgi:hypothetical protein
MDGYTQPYFDIYGLFLYMFFDTQMSLKFRALVLVVRDFHAMIDQSE